jgi:RNA polymerase sigma-70 factor, ECF subfamily
MYSLESVSGDKLDTFVETAEQQRGHLLWVAQRFVPYREEAEDIVQEALLKAFRNLAQFRGDAQMSTWLHTIVLNTARDWLRNQKGRIYQPLEQTNPADGNAVVLDFPHPSENPEQRCEREEMEWLLRAEIEKMSSVSRRAIQLCVLEEFSHRAAANALDVSVITVKSRVFAGKQRLKRAVRLHIGRGRG